MLTNQSSKKFADLHIHSVRSDGTCTYEEIIEKIKQRDIKIFSITDHNIIPDMNLLKKYALDNDLIYIPGVEVDCRFEDNIIHILIYGFTPQSIKNSDIENLINKSRYLLDLMSIDLIEKMKKDYPIYANEYEEFEKEPSLGGWKGIQFLLHKKITTSLRDGMGLYSSYNCNYTDYDFPMAKDVCSSAKKIGAFAILAHPSNWYSDLSQEQLIKKFELLKNIGIDGIECFYPSNDKMMTQTSLNFCEKNNLFITAGGDFHGEFLKQVNGILYDLGVTETPIENIKIPNKDK